MTTAELALCVSCASLVLSLVSFTWNVWSKFIFPKPIIRIAVWITYNGESRKRFSADAKHEITIQVSNHGPITCDLTSFWCASKIPSYGDWDGLTYSSGETYPMKLVVGEMNTTGFDLNARNSAYLGTIDEIGVEDAFGRRHRAPRDQVERVRQKAVEFDRRIRGRP